MSFTILSILVRDRFSLSIVKSFPSSEDLEQSFLCFALALHFLFVYSNCLLCDLDKSRYTSPADLLSSAELPSLFDSPFQESIVAVFAAFEDFWEPAISVWVLQRLIGLSLGIRGR